MKMKFISNFNSVTKKIENTERKVRKKASSYLKKKLKQKVKKKYGNGNLYKGVYKKDLINISLIGFGPPAHHAHLIEFGTDARFIKKYHGKPGVKVSSGRMIADPILETVFEEENIKIEEILSKRWF